MFDLKHTKHLVLYGRNIIESLMVREAKAFMAAVGGRDAMHLYRPSGELHGLQGDAVIGKCARTAITH